MRSSALLHNPTVERDACGIGFVADPTGRASRAVVDLLLAGLTNVRHRGATAADRLTGDGAGVLLPIPTALRPEPGCGLAMVFLRDGGAREAVEAACAQEGLEPAGWRPVPVSTEALGDEARASLPTIEQLVLLRPQGLDEEEVELRAYRARRRLDHVTGAYAVSLSYRTVTYKALCAADHLADFYADLRDRELAVPFGIFHQRFSTNTGPTWERAQPFRLLCHNGEINAVRGNVNWMRARAGRLGFGDPLLDASPLDESGSDSAILDNALEAIVRGGRDVRHAIAMLVPESWELNPVMPEEIRDFYRYHAGLVEPWDGPAGIVFTDGRVVGATLDRNGLRPLRYAVVEGGLVACASEAGAVPLPDGGPVARGKLGPNQMLTVDPERGVEAGPGIKFRLARRRPYGQWLAEGIRRVGPGEPVAPPEEDLSARQVLAGYTREELSLVLRPVGTSGHDPVSSMGDDTALPPLAGRARPLASYFRQGFAQVTNPAIDHLRERLVMSLRTVLGARAPLLSEGPEAARLIELESFFLYPSTLDELEPALLDATFDAAEGLRAACERLVGEAVDAVSGGSELLLVSDRRREDGRPPIPVLLAAGAVHQRLVAAGLRTSASLLVESDEPRETHHFATLLGYGADAICPTLALETMAALARADRIGGDHPSPDEAQRRFREAVEDGLLKVMSKMGISDVASYRGAQIFEAIGLSQEVVDLAFTGTPSPLGGIGLTELEAEALARAAAAGQAAPKLENPGYVKFRKGGEPHATTPEVVSALQDVRAAHHLRKAVGGGGGWDLYERFAGLVNERTPLEPRDLLELVPAGPPVPLDELEPVADIVRRFSGGAMSLGALSSEAHELIGVALARIGARANTGEGGEERERFRTESNSAIKQVASGRFGVTPEYAAFAQELQIKIAQGSKPGEGGQLPGHKVTAEIARMRHTQPGVALISPPPHHDIYSIEDLAQLIFDLRQVNPAADVSVKLVAEAGVGIVAAGVVKALADVVHVAGADGGTGASPLTSIKNTGAPWELGLAETQQALVASGLRGRVRVRVDGGFKTGRDVVVAALLGADEVSFGTALLIAEGCLLVRTCHMDTCPVGIATQRPELRAKFEATPEMVETYLLLVAEETRRLLASLGLRSLEEAVGRVELLRQRATGDPRADALDLTPLLGRAEGGPGRFAGEHGSPAGGSELGRRLADDAAAALTGSSLVELSYPIGNGDRTVGARLGGRIGKEFGLGGPPGRVRARFEGVAGQSFGAFLAAGVELDLVGEANDYVGKGMSGGRIVVRPAADDAGDPCLLGNTVLYGATGGELFCAGSAGERLAVRNSGAVAVVEGAGDHACEYMTSGTVVILGRHGVNLGAGMSGGEVFVHDPEERLLLRLNDQLVAARRLDLREADALRELVERHHRHTDSARAEGLLARWEEAVREFWQVRPKANVAVLQSAYEGTEDGSPATDAA
jgi:glutamate synthase domain-containing protein 2/glutamate synthase domain-containing protein 1/glutamate synthase domain-containing protein 3